MVHELGFFGGPCKAARQGLQSFGSQIPNSTAFRYDDVYPILYQKEELLGRHFTYFWVPGTVGALMVTHIMVPYS